MPFHPHRDGVRIALRANPGGAHNMLAGLHIDADKQKYLKASVTVVAEGGKANKALIALLAKTWRQPKSAFKLLSGETSRHKTILLSGDTDHLLKMLTDWLSAAELAKPI